MPKPASGSKTARLAAGTLLTRQAAADRAIRRAANASIDDAAAKTKKKERATAALLLLLRAKKAFTTAVGTVIYEHRQAAREAARSRLYAELRGAGIDVKGHQWVSRARNQDDVESADRAAASLAVQWNVMATGALLGADAKEQDAAAAIRSTRQAIAVRVRRTAETEVATAYSNEHREALTDLVEHDRSFRDGELADRIEDRTAREWSALIDACERCWPLDGVRVGIGEPFPGGEEPGEVHPRCRCIELLVRI